MQHAILLSQDIRVINEFTQICAVTGMELEIAATISQAPINSVVFVDESSEDISIALTHVHVLCIGQPTPRVWLLAGQLNAASILIFPHDRSQIIELLTPSTQASGKVIGVTSATGGAGTTTLASAIAHQLKNTGHQAILLDINSGYAALDLLLGYSSQDIVYSSSVIDMQSFGIEGLNTVDDLAFIANNSNHSATQWQNLVAYLKSKFEYVILDIESTSADETIFGLCDEVVVALTNTIHGTAVTRILLNSLQEWNIMYGLAVRSLGGTSLNPLTIAEKLNTPLWASIPTDNRIIEQIECGFGVSMVKLSSFNRAIAQLTLRLSGAATNVRSA